MAEVVGLVAAGVAFAEVVAKIGSQVLILRGLWKDIRDIPDNMKSLANDIDLLNMVLQEIEADLSNPDCSDGMSTHIMASCRNALDGLTASTNELSLELHSIKRFRRTMAMCKLALKRDFWAKDEKRLQRVVWMLGLAQQCWAISLTKRQPDILISRLRLSSRHVKPSQIERSRMQEIKDSSDVARKSNWIEDWEGPKFTTQYLSPSFVGSLVLHSTQSNDRTPSSQYYVQIRPPSWLSQKVWNIFASNGYSGFKLFFRVYSVVPRNSAVMSCARRGDIKGLMDLFDKKSASPFDRSEDGDRLIDAALWSGDIQAIATMTNWGLDLDPIFDPTSTSVCLVSVLTLPRHKVNYFQSLQAFHDLALSKNAYNSNAESWLLAPWSKEEQDQEKTDVRFMVTADLSQNPTAMRLLLEHLRPGHYQLPAKHRLSFLMFDVNDIDSDSLRYVIRKDGKIRSEDIQELDQDEFPILKLISWRYKTELVIDRKMSPRRQKWRKLARDVMRSTRLLHSQAKPSGSLRRRDPPLGRSRCLCFPPGTALHAVIDGPFVGIPYPLTFAGWRRVTERALQHWLEDLEMCNIDLNGYGETEERLFLRSKSLRSLRYGPNMDSCCGAIWTLATFSYGPKPQDWKFSWDLGVEELVGEFWDTIENPPLKIIGAWVDDSEI